MAEENERKSWLGEWDWPQRELTFLVAFAVALPMHEAPKNIFWFLYLIAWLVNRVPRRQFGGPWRPWDSLIAVVLAGAAVDAAFAGMHYGEWGGARDVARYGLFLWAVSRTRYDARQWRWLFAALFIGTLVASADGALTMVLRDTQELVLGSVGHSNHSAIFLAIVFGGAMAWTLAFWKALAAGERALWIAGTIACALAIVATGSRIAVVVAAAYGLVLGLWFGRRSWKPLAAITSAVGVAAVLIVVVQPWVVQKHLRDVSENNVLAFRGPIWERAVTTWREFPAFGVGMDNFSQVDSARYREWLERQGGSYVAARDLRFSHAHSLYLNALAERGLFGVGILLAFLGAWGYAQVRTHPLPRDDLAWALWGASLSAWFVTVTIGLVNTTLHTEHALVSMLFLGGWLSYRDRQRE